MGRKILFVTTDQQRYDTLGCNGGTLARTPVVDGLAARRASATSGPSRSRSCACRRARRCSPASTRRTHGVWMNGVPLPVDAPSVAARAARRRLPHRARSARPHFEPFLDPFAALHRERARPRPARRRPAAPHRGFEHLEFATHGAAGPLHYAQLAAGRTIPRRSAMFYPVLDGDLEVNAAGGGDTGAPQVHVNPIPRELVPHRLGRRSHDRVARLARRRRRLVLLDELPRPAPPVGPAAVGGGPRRLARRAAARRLPEPTRPSASAILDAKPRHWRLWYDGTLVSNYEAPTRLGAGDAHRRPGPRGQRPQRGRVRADRRGARPRARARSTRAAGPTTSTSIFTTDHGELQGDFGLLFKGPYHVDALMRLPLVWRPAPSAGVAPAVVTAPGRPRRPRADVLRDRRRRRRPSGCRARRCRSTTPTPTRAASSGCSPSGTASCSASACTCARSPATAGCAPRTCPGYRARRHRGRAVRPRRRSAAAASTGGTIPVAASLRDDLARRPVGQPAPAHEPRLQLEAPV